jgi:hypothetical protein
VQKAKHEEELGIFIAKTVLSDGVISSQVNGYCVRMRASNGPPALIEGHWTSIRPMSFVFSLNKYSPVSFSATCVAPIHVRGILYFIFEGKEFY